MASATAAGSPGRGLTHSLPSPTCGAGATRLAFGSYAGSVTPVSGGDGAAGGGGAGAGAAGGGGGSGCVVWIVGPLARVSRVPRTETIGSPACFRSLTADIVLRHRDRQVN